MDSLFIVFILLFGIGLFMTGFWLGTAIGGQDGEQILHFFGKHTWDKPSHFLKGGYELKKCKHCPKQKLVRY